MNQESFDDIIRKKVEQYSAPVPADAWDNIMGGKKKRRFVFFWWVFGVLIAGGIAVGVISGSKESVIISKNKETEDSEQTITNKKVVIIKNKETENNEQTLTNKEAVIIKNKETENNEQTLINKEAGIISKNKKTQDSEQTLISKDNIYQQSDKNVDGETDSSSEQGLISNNIHPVLKTDRIDIQLIKTYYFQTLIDYSIAHVPVDTNRIKKAAKKSVWAIDFSITPFIPIQKNEALSYLQRTKITDNYQTIYTANETQTSEELSFAYSFVIRRKINKKLELGTGLQYSRIREKVWLSGKEINTTFSVIQRLHNGNSGPYLLNDTYESNTSGTRIINAYNSYNTYSIPVFIQYALAEQRYFSLYLNTGAYVNVIRKYSNSIDGDFNVAYVSGMKQGSHKMNMGVDLFAGLRLVSPGKKYRFFAEPNFRYSLMKNNTSNMINAKYIHQAGLSVGISYYIK